MFTSISYIGYLFLLFSYFNFRKGTTLWNTVVGFTGELFKNLIYEFYNLENIFSSLMKYYFGKSFLLLTSIIFEKIFNNIFSNQDLHNKLKIKFLYINQ